MEEKPWDIIKSIVNTVQEICKKSEIHIHNVKCMKEIFIQRNHLNEKKDQTNIDTSIAKSLKAIQSNIEEVKEIYIERMELLTKDFELQMQKLFFEMQIQSNKMNSTTECKCSKKVLNKDTQLAELNGQLRIVCQTCLNIFSMEDTTKHLEEMTEFQKKKLFGEMNLSLLLNRKPCIFCNNPEALQLKNCKCKVCANCLKEAAVAKIYYEKKNLKSDGIHFNCPNCSSSISMEEMHKIVGDHIQFANMMKVFSQKQILDRKPDSDVYCCSSCLKAFSIQYPPATYGCYHRILCAQCSFSSSSCVFCLKFGKNKQILIIFF